MINIKKNVAIITTTAITTAIGTIVITNGVKTKAPELNNEINENSVILKTENKQTQSSYNKVKEINEDNVKLVVFESSEGKYERILTANDWIQVSSKLSTHYSYNATIDLSKAAYVYEVNGVTFVEIDTKQIKLDTIMIDEPIVKTDMNFFNQFKGKTIEENMNQLVILSYEHIDEIVQQQFNDNHDKMIKNTKDKVRGLYEGLDNVQVKFK